MDLAWPNVAGWRHTRILQRHVTKDRYDRRAVKVPDARLNAC